jgi:hypothetical protein
MSKPLDHATLLKNLLEVEVAGLSPRASAPLNDDDVASLRRDNSYFRARCDALQGEVWDLSGRLAKALSGGGDQNAAKSSFVFEG